MPVSQGDLIRATHFNDLRDKVESVLGNGVGDLGYGQTLKSKRANAPFRNADGTTTYDIINRIEWDNLINDMARCREHQTGLEQRQGGTLPSINNSTEISADIYNDLEIFANTIFNERASIAIVPGPGITVQGAVSSPLVQKSYSSNWNKKLYLIVTASFQPDVDKGFSAADSARHFFNAGGEIRLDLDIENANNKKEQEYEQMFDEFGIIRLKANETTNGDKTVTRGFNQLTTTDQQIWSMAGRGYYYYAYSNLDVVVTATTNSDKSSIVMTVELRDDDYGNVDEAIDATITGKVFTLQPVGDNVELPNPDFTSTNWSGSYDANAAQPPAPPPAPPPSYTPFSTSISPSVDTVSTDYGTSLSGYSFSRTITVRGNGDGGGTVNLSTSTDPSFMSLTASPSSFYLSSGSSRSVTVTGSVSNSISNPWIFRVSSNYGDSYTRTVNRVVVPNTVTVSPLTLQLYTIGGNSLTNEFATSITGQPNTKFYFTSTGTNPGYITSTRAEFTLDSNGQFNTVSRHTGSGTFYYTIEFETGSPSSIQVVQVVNP
jgi:hypothetical protein